MYSFTEEGDGDVKMAGCEAGGETKKKGEDELDPITYHDCHCDAN